MPFKNTGTLLLHLDGRIVFASTYFCDLVDIDHDKASGMSYFDFVFPEEMEEAKNQMETCKFVVPPPYFRKLRTSKGAPVWVAIQCSPLQTAAGETYAVSAAITAAQQPVNGNAEKR